MKLLSVAVAMVVLAASFVVSKPAMANDALVVSICNYVAADDKNRLRKKLKSSKVKLRNIYDGVSCNGLSLLQFSMSKKANNVGVYIVKRLPGSKLKTGADFNWATENGFADSEIAVAIKARAGF
ncbi:MAG: hypothetical protein ACI9FJ_002188 [Alteromonadaceae bacterium]|jgi:hypothetical protein